MPFWKKENPNGLDSVGTGLVLQDESFRMNPCPYCGQPQGFILKGFTLKGCPYDLILILMQTKSIQRKSPRLKDFDYSQPFAYFITICAKDKQRTFCNEALNSEIINCLKQEKEKAGMKVFAYCLMPNHLHMLISPADSGVNISRFIGSFKSKATRIG